MATGERTSSQSGTSTRPRSGSSGEVLGINRRIVAKKRSSKTWTSHKRVDAGLGYDTTDQILGLRFDRGLDAAAISATVRTGLAKVENVIARHDSSVHKRETPEICRVR